MERWLGDRGRGTGLRSYHRKTLVRKESWPLIEDWYFCPATLAAERVQKELERLNAVSIIKPSSPIWYSFNTWRALQFKLEARLAHACTDGRIRAPSWIEYYKTKGGGVSIYGKCRRCEKALSDGIKGIIIMELEL